jgi:sulfur-oxidizing protein SoxX
MRNTAKHATMALSLAALFTGAALVPQAASAGTESITKGKEVAFDRKKGNCLACHAIDDGTLPGDIGPPLIAMKARFPERKKLFNQIYDATRINPETRMPPFGRHKILSNDEINEVIDYLYTL